jgi:hypothetical protein
MNWPSIALFLLLATVAVAQGSADSASGTLQIAKQQFPLKHAFAAMEADPFSNGEKENHSRILRCRMNCAKLPTTGASG